MKCALMISVTAEALESLFESERQAFDEAHRSLTETEASGELPPAFASSPKSKTIRR